MRIRCQNCGEYFLNDEDHPEYGKKLCYYCFEDGLEDHEERKRERIARENEY
jgi:formylmethanofuran dehydrogenase subunit E